MFENVITITLAGSNWAEIRRMVFMYRIIKCIDQDMH